VAAVAGNGQRELVRSIIGLCAVEDGSIFLDGRDITSQSVGRRRSLGIGYMPEERLGEGINRAATVEDNLILGLHRGAYLRRGMWLRRSQTRKLAASLIREYDIRASGPDARAETLSGGNLQRIIAAREIALEPRLFIAEDPTAGLDIQAATFIRAQMLLLRDRGVGVLLVSSELEELFELADRVIVLYHGRIVGNLTADEVSEDRVGGLMVGAS
jgi:simple sugar transport system ATP-binding protein